MERTERAARARFVAAYLAVIAVIDVGIVALGWESVHDTVIVFVGTAVLLVVAVFLVAPGMIRGLKRLDEWREDGHWKEEKDHRRPRSRRGPAAANLGAVTRTGTRARADEGTSEGAGGAGTGLEPVRGWKLARLARYDSWTFVPLAGGFPYGVEAVALCVYGHTHRPPDLKCSCGFYAWNEPREIASGQQVLLEVELYGRVIVAERGYRAEKQRVLSATIAGEDLHATCGWSIPTIPGGGGPTCPPAHYVGDADGLPLCALHALASRRRYHELVEPDFVRDEVRRDLPTDWRFV